MPDTPDPGTESPPERPPEPPPANPFDIETLPLDERIEGKEGLDVNHASRLRMQFLTSQQASLVTQTQFADAKAAALMTLMGLVALNGPVRIGGSGPQQIGEAAIFVMLFAAIGFALWAIIPRFPDAGLARLVRRRDRFSWPALVGRDFDPLEHAAFMRTAEASQLVMSIAQANAAMARVLRRKFVALRIAFIIAAVDLVLVVLYVLGLHLG